MQALGIADRRTGKSGPESLVRDCDGHWCWFPDSAVANLDSLLPGPSAAPDVPRKNEECCKHKPDASTHPHAIINDGDCLYAFPLTDFRVERQSAAAKNRPDQSVEEIVDMHNSDGAVRWTVRPSGAADAITIPHVELKRGHLPLILEYAKGLIPLDGDDESLSS
jgi:hypothetical protein